ncbi:MAG: hypothetical protein MZU95_11115 [Desulfomicrobium escambiense]|nr:hypothetical protein [Desulfomicrobium escambiense]
MGLYEDSTRRSSPSWTAFWGELYRTVGLSGSSSRMPEYPTAFDRKVIDGVVDGSATSVRGVGICRAEAPDR